MNDILGTLPTGQAETILVNALSAFLPDPGVTVTTTPVDDGFVELQNKVIGEIRRHLNIGAEDDSPEARQRIVGVLAELMNNLMLPSQEESQVRKRLARKGLLRSADYDIAFETLFERSIGGRTVSREQVRDALRHPSVEAHYGPNGLSELREAEFSISLRRYTTRTSERSYTLLVLWVAHADLKHVTSAWRIYDHQVPHSIDWSPLKVLRAFLDVFGCEFRLLEREPTRLMVFDEIPVLRPVQRISDLMQLVTIDDRSPKLIEEFARTEFKETLSTERISFFFVIDVSKYAAAIRRHGIRVPHQYFERP